jgi:hypothetical protein
MLHTLLSLKNNGTLKHLVLNGLMSAKIFTYIEIYLWVDARSKTTTQSLNNIVSDAELAFGVCRRTVWNALKVIKTMANESHPEANQTSAKSGAPLKPKNHRTFVS